MASMADRAFSYELPKPSITGTAEAYASITLKARATDGTTQSFTTTALANGTWVIDTSSTAIKIGSKGKAAVSLSASGLPHQASKPQIAATPQMREIARGVLLPASFTSILAASET